MHPQQKRRLNEKRRSQRGKAKASSTSKPKTPGRICTAACSAKKLIPQDIYAEVVEHIINTAPTAAKELLKKVGGVSAKLRKENKELRAYVNSMNSTLHDLRSLKIESIIKRRWICSVLTKQTDTYTYIYI